MSDAFHHLLIGDELLENESKTLSLAIAEGFFNLRELLSLEIAKASGKEDKAKANVKNFLPLNAYEAYLKKASENDNQ